MNTAQARAQAQCAVHIVYIVGYKYNHIIAISTWFYFIFHGSMGRQCIEWQRAKDFSLSPAHPLVHSMKNWKCFLIANFWQIIRLTSTLENADGHLNYLTEAEMKPMVCFALQTNSRLLSTTTTGVDGTMHCEKYQHVIEAKGRRFAAYNIKYLVEPSRAMSSHRDGVVVVFHEATCLN